MDNKQKEMLEGLKLAIKGERDGHSFYKMAARTTEDSKGQEVFDTLASEELDHMRFLKEQYDSILKTGKPNTSINFGSKLDLSGMSPIFSDDLKSRLTDAHMEMSALSIGIQLELDAMKFYKEQSEKAEVEEVSKFYDELAEWEKGHYQALLNQQESLRDDYWDSAGFAPF
ncbi:MAG: hypothetical protein GF404_10880 [candidate division Zixibacteria bacterium]|nr:hypothetical protein [candidate division Zixibacteria bacterium]